jgi:pyruvate dehydrogenase E2 component (dihydrolipoamide acetyltransferase)
MPDFKLPDLGEGLSEAEIDRWLVKEGDVVAEDDPLVEVITDKATAEIPSPFAGVVTKVHVEAGQIVPVGTVIITIGEGAAMAGPPPPPPPPPTEVTLPPSPEAEASVDASVGEGDRIKATPPVRKLARELGLDLSAISGTGPEGRVTRADVEQATGTGAVGTPSGETPQTPDRREPLRGVRRIIAQRMSEAHSIIPPVTHVEECDVTELEATRDVANERAPGEPKLTFMPFIVKAVVTTLKNYPAINASLDEEAQEIVYHDHYDIGIAVDTPAGLTVPVVRNADRLRLRQIATEIDRLAHAAREGTIGAEDLRGGTFTITSPGKFGGLMATPIVFHPQAAILGVHRATQRPVARDGQIVIRTMMNMSITFDHRILDGMTAAKFVLDVVKLLEHPAVLALES